MAVSATFADDRCRRLVGGHACPVQCAAWSPDGCWTATADRNGCIQIWRAVTTAPDASSGGGAALPVAYTFPHRSNDAVTAMTFSDDATLVAATSRGKVDTLDLHTMSLIKSSSHFAAPRGVEAPPSHCIANCVASAATGGATRGDICAVGYDDNTLSLFDARIGKRFAQETLASPVTSVTFDSSGSLLLCGSVDGHVGCYDTRGGRTPSEVNPANTRSRSTLALDWTLEAHADVVSDIIRCKASRRLVSVGMDGAIALVDIGPYAASSEERLLTIAPHDDPNPDRALLRGDVTDNDQHVILGCSHGGVNVYALSTSTHPSITLTAKFMSSHHAAINQTCVAPAAAGHRSDLQPGEVLLVMASSDGTASISPFRVPG